MYDSIAKEKKWGKKCLEIMSIKGGEDVRRLMEKTILNFHFDSWNPSLNMMISSVHLNQRFLKNLSRLRALVSRRRKSHKG